MPVVLLIYLLVGKKQKNIFLLIASLFFYSWGETYYVLIILSSIVVNFFSGILIDRYRSNYKAKLVLTGSLIINLGLLGWFKYSGFAIENVNDLFTFLNLPLIDSRSVHLPIGISFFTFQAISYIVDVYNEKTPSQKNFIDIALYISCFPQLIAGPIVRYREISRQLQSRIVRFNDFSIGVNRFIIGLGKKVIIANPMGEITDQILSSTSDGLTASLAWTAAICYSLQIYFDFSGYSDMAIGLGRMFGFTFPENFRYPYISRSIREFWTRWHISLSSWFRDYLYIPLGGNRNSPARTCFNLFFVFFLCGLWHGASWNFVLWGMIHGIFLILERIGLGKLLKKMWAPFQHLYTLVIIITAWMFFRIDNLHEALLFVKAMFGYPTGDGNALHLSYYLTNKYIFVFVLGILGSMPFINLFNYLCSLAFKYRENLLGHCMQLSFSFTKVFFLVSVFIFSVMFIASGTYNPFIYFRF